MFVHTKLPYDNCAAAVVDKHVYIHACFFLCIIITFSYVQSVCMGVKVCGETQGPCYTWRYTDFRNRKSILHPIQYYVNVPLDMLFHLLP